MSLVTSTSSTVAGLSFRFRNPAQTSSPARPRDRKLGKLFPSNQANMNQQLNFPPPCSNISDTTSCHNDELYQFGAEYTAFNPEPPMDMVSVTSVGNADLKYLHQEVSVSGVPSGVRQESTGSQSQNRNMLPFIEHNDERL